MANMCSSLRPPGLGWLASTLFVATTATAAVPLAIGPGTQFSDPDVSRDGTRGIMTRSYWTCSGGTCSATTDIVTFDLLACSRDVIRETTVSNVLSSNARAGAISGDGKVIAYVKTDGSTDTLVTRAWPDSAEIVALSGAPKGSILTPDLSGNGRYLVCYLGVTGSEALTVRDLTLGISKVIEPGTPVGRARHRTVTNDGTVYYHKNVGGTQRIFRCGPFNASCVPDLLCPPHPNTSLTSVSASEDGIRFVFLSGDTITGIQNVWSSDADCAYVTSNAEPDAVWPSLVSSWDGGRAVFVTDADLGGSNPDHVQQVWRVLTMGGGLKRLTEIPFSPLDPAHLTAVANGDGSVVAYSRYDCALTLGTCQDPDALNKGRVQYESIDAPPVVLEPGDLLTKNPPFELVADGTPACVTSGSDVVCSVALRNGAKTWRNVLLVPEAEFPIQGSCIEATILLQQPTQVLLDTVDAALIHYSTSFTTPCGSTPPTGTFRLHAVSPDVAQADVAVFSSEFGP